MKCEQIQPYLPGYAGGDLRPETTQLVAGHLGDCGGCRAEAARLARVTGGLPALAGREVTPPPMLLESILEDVGSPKVRRFVPPLIPPTMAPDIARVVQDNKETIASAGATALVAAGAAYALWRAVRRRPSGAPAAP